MRETREDGNGVGNTGGGLKGVERRRMSVGGCVWGKTGGGRMR